QAEALRHAETALATMRTALEAYARVARDRSDLGALATMAEYVDRPLKAKVAQLKSDRAAKAAATADPAVRAVEFESRKVYQSRQRPSYPSWVSFFPGEKGQWYLTCEEVTRPEKPLPQCTRQQWYEMSLPVGYDKSQYRMEMVLLESK